MQPLSRSARIRRRTVRLEPCPKKHTGRERCGCEGRDTFDGLMALRAGEGEFTSYIAVYITDGSATVL
jgi:hypothetical protein